MQFKKASTPRVSIPRINQSSKIFNLFLMLSLLLCILLPLRVAPVRANPADDWWNSAWPYRLRVDITGSGIAQANINFTTALNTLGLNHALLDLRSIRVVPYYDSTPGNPIPYAESYSTMFEDADDPQIGWHASGFYWQINDGGYADADKTRFTQGLGSLKAVVINTTGGYGYPGVELKTSSAPLTNWNAYETFIYDIWPEVNASALDQAPDLYWYKLYNACGGSPITQGGPPLALDQWNPVSVSLNPLDSCWPIDGLDLSNITRMEFHTRDNETVNGNSGLWDDGDQLALWFDNMRLVDQDQGTVRWQTISGASSYYIYFDVLTHEGHPLPEINDNLGTATLIGTTGTPEAGGYYHLIEGTTNAGDLQIWAAPTIEKILKNQTTPIHRTSLRFSAARGEFEPIQIVVNAPSTQSLPVSISDFTLDTTNLTADNISIHRVDYVDITSAGDHFDRFGWWPDPLYPINFGDTINFRAGENQPLWITFQIPWDAPAGIYEGIVMIGPAEIPIELEVWDFALPREIHLPSEWGFSWSSIVQDIYQGYGDWDCYWEMVETFKQDFIDHRLSPKGVAWPAGLNYPGGIEYDCNGGLLPDAWGDWDFATIGGKYIHGEDDFNSGYGFPEFLAFGPTSNWPPDSLPYSFCGISRSGVLGSSEFQMKWTQYLSALNTYLVSDNYTNAYYHIVNEPQTFDDYAIAGQISALTESAAPNFRQLVSEQVEPDIYNYPGSKIDIWMPTITNYEPVKSHDRQKNHAEDVWWYYLYGDDPPLPNPILMSHPGIEARITPWLAWTERIDGLLHYSATDWSPNPWENPNVTGKDNGDGFLFYPPNQDGGNLAFCGENDHRLVPSIRWENLRDGMEDYEYLWLLAGGDPQIDVSNEADEYVAQLVGSRTLNSHVPTDLFETRAAVAAAIMGVLTESRAEKSALPTMVAPGETLTYTLSYTHIGDETTLVVNDTIPTATEVLSTDGPGTVVINGQVITWTVSVSDGNVVVLSIQARAGSEYGSVTNSATFYSDETRSAQTTVFIYNSQISLPLVMR